MKTVPTQVFGKHDDCRGDCCARQTPSKGFRNKPPPTRGQRNCRRLTRDLMITRELFVCESRPTYVACRWFFFFLVVLSNIQYVRCNIFLFVTFDLKMFRLHQFYANLRVVGIRIYSHNDQFFTKMTKTLL